MAHFPKQRLVNKPILGHVTEEVLLKFVPTDNTSLVQKRTMARMVFSDFLSSVRVTQNRIVRLHHFWQMGRFVNPK